MNLVLATKKEIINKKLFPLKRKVIVAISGGIDSIALLDVLAKIMKPIDIIIAHVNHGLRKESKEELLFVKQIAKQYGVKMVSTVFSGIKRRKGNLEENARRERYDFLLSVAKKEGAETIITAHHGDDQLETALLNLKRGTGIKGLLGMDQKREFSGHEKEIFIIRPFLWFLKKDIEEYQQEASLEFRQDKTNWDNSLKRNFFRNKVLSRISYLNKRNLLLRIKDLKREYEETEKEIRKFLNKISQKKGRAILIDRNDFNSLGRALQNELFAIILRDINGGKLEDFSSLHIKQVVSLSRKRYHGKGTSGSRWLES